MTKREVIGLCLSFKDSYEDYPFDSDAGSPGAWTVIRHKDGKKGFAHIYQGFSGPVINVKLPPLEGDTLRAAFKGIAPAYHMNKEHWSGVDPNGDVPLEMLKALIEKSYELTKPKGRRPR
jgi:predicted DNA-binding protein (MmcQ/YjbR family)